MVKFLLQHALEMEEKEDEIQPSPSIDMAMVEQSVQFERGRITHGILMDMQNIDRLR